MKWLPPAAALLLSAEASSSYSNSRHASCFIASHPNRGVWARKPLIDANSNSAHRGIGIAVPPSPCSPTHSDDTVVRKNTALYMGIREMFGRGKDKKEEDDDEKPKTFSGDDANPEDIQLALEAIKADLEAVSGEKKTTRKKKKKPDPTISKASASVARKVKEIVQPKPEPTTSASTYGESVRDRINRVKSGHMTEEEKAQFLNTALTRAPPGSKGPRIRQEIPSPDEKKGGKSNASPVRKDALWNTVIGTTSPLNRNDSPYKNTIRFNSKGERLDDSAKREYLDMVTNPERFSSYAAMGGYKTGESKGKHKNEVVENLNLLDAPSNDEIADRELATRLESAAIMREKEDAKIKAEKQVKKKSEMERFAADQRRRAEEARKREESEISAKRVAEEKKREAEIQKIEAEKKRLADMQAAQDAYWANKLKTEKKKDPAEERVKQVSKEDAFNAEQAAKKEAELAKINRMEQQNKEKSLESPGKANDDTKNSGDFVETQEKKKAALDQFMKEQKDRLATLSSPLPFQNSPLPKVQPRKPNSTSSSPPATIPSLNLTDLTMKKSQSATPAPTPAPAPAPAPASADSSPRLSLAEMTMLNKNKSNGNTVRARPTTPPSPRTSGSGPIRQSVPVKDDNNEEDDFFAYARSGGNSNMSIKDIMAAQNEGDNGKSTSESDVAKQKSKMWGIDIDAFMD